MRRTVLYTALLIPVTLNCQISSVNDTILVKEVVINSPAGRSIPGFKILTIDSAMIADYDMKSLADLISENSTVFVKSYGPGALANPSIRGTGPGHTIISWNEINLNSPMLGQFDMSLIPAGFIDKVEILPGGGSMDISDGGLGGIINLETGPEWRKRTLIFLNPSVASFGSISGLAKLNTGSSGFQSVTRILINRAHNNFPYINSLNGPEPVIERRKNNEIAQEGFIQEFYIRSGRGIISGRFWYQSSSRNLPLPLSMLMVNTGEKQEDQSFRSLLNYKNHFARTDLNISCAFLSDRLHYSNRLASIDSRNLSNSFIFKMVSSRQITEKLRFKLSLDHILNNVNTTNYPSERFRNISSVLFSAESEPVKWFKSRVLIREIMQDRRFLKPDLSIGIEIEPFPERNFIIHAGISRNSKVPTLNDMYWMPGGNPDLKNETGYASEAGIEFDAVSTSRLTGKCVITGFINSIKDMIQWYPGEYSYWSAGNINNVRTKGIEARLDLVYSGSTLNIRSLTNYIFTKATSVTAFDNNRSEIEQLVYTPENQLNTMIKVSWSRFFSIIRENYTGRRFITADNLQYLPGYLLTDFDIGARVNYPGLDSELGFTIGNVFNESYQNIAWYPMPGRSYLLYLIIKFKL